MAKKTPTQNARAPKTESTTRDAVALLKADHDEVDALFKEFESVKDEAGSEELRDIVQQVCAMLTVHAQIEEEIFYPAVRDAGEGVDDLLNEADVEHRSLKDLIGRLGEMDASDEMCIANVTVLAEYVKHHAKEEEGELFPKVRKSDLGLEALGDELAARKEELEGATVG